MISEQSSIPYRIIVIGNAYVGKTSLLNKLTDGLFIDKYKATLGVDFRTKEIEIDNEKIKLEVWDTAGQERFKALTVKYYQKADGIIVAFSIENYDSFKLVGSWINSAKEYATNDVPLLLTGCKCDMENERTVSKDEVMRFCKENELQYIETSAKENINVLRLFEEMAKIIKGKGNHKKRELEMNKKNKTKKGCC